MNVVSIDAWRLPGCGEDCAAGRHDPRTHEEYGRILERGDMHAHIVRTGPLTVDLRAARAFVGDREIGLSPIEWSALVFLARNIGRVVSSDDLIDHLWGRAYRGIERNALANLRMVVGYRLRGRLGDDGRLIVTVPGLGYRLDDGATPVASATQATPPTRRWALAWDACQLCRSATRPHHTRGLCARCHSRQKRAGKFL